MEIKLKKRIEEFAPAAWLKEIYANATIKKYASHDNTTRGAAPDPGLIKRNMDLWEQGEETWLEKINKNKFGK